MSIYVFDDGQTINTLVLSYIALKLVKENGDLNNLKKEYEDEMKKRREEEEAEEVQRRQEKKKMT